nr:2-C-methyl-D-erythritol 4-phosphate cytidylyltransferase [uncultured Glaciecola sp.]
MTAVDTFVAVVPAAGIGSRMMSSVAKQYLTIGNKTVIEHTLDALLSHHQIQRIVVVLHPQDCIFRSLKVAQNPLIETVIGGTQRVDSVLSGLKHCLIKPAPNVNPWILVHDAARPCVTHAELNDLFACINTCEGAILAVPVTDTIKRATSKENSPIAEIEETVERTQLWHAQTPQFFPLQKLIDAIELAQRNKINITDEASAMEHVNASVKLIEGRNTNIKITRPCDLALAEFYLTATVSANNNKNNKQGGTLCTA